VYPRTRYEEATVTAVATPARAPRLPRGVSLTLISLVAVFVYYLLLVFIISRDPDPTTSASAFRTAAQQVANALSIGAIYALIALGYTMVYGIIELINFAHGDVFMVGAFIASWVLLSAPGTGPIGFLGDPHGPFGFLGGLGLKVSGSIDNIPLLIIYIAVALAITMPLTGGLNVLIERFFYRPLRNAPRLAPLITAIGVSFILQNVMLVAAGSGDRRAPQIFPGAWSVNVPLVGARIPLLDLFIFVLALTLMIALTQFVSRTRLGRAMRATAQDREASQLMGVDLNQTIALTFLLGGALAGAAGVVWGLRFPFVRQDLGFNAGLKAFTSAVLGGIGNITGAVLGGFIIGFVEVGAATIGLLRWAELIVFAILTLVLVFRPAGLLGQQIGERA
jgi:branched-chain amino acid transport system permease protein